MRNEECKREDVKGIGKYIQIVSEIGNIRVHLRKIDRNDITSMNV